MALGLSKVPRKVPPRFHRGSSKFSPILYHFLGSFLYHRWSKLGHIHQEWQLRRIGMQNLKCISPMSRSNDKKVSWLQIGFSLMMLLSGSTNTFLLPGGSGIQLFMIHQWCWCTSNIVVSGRKFLLMLICNTEMTFTPTSHQVMQCI